MLASQSYSNPGECEWQWDYYFSCIDANFALDEILFWGWKAEVISINLFQEA